MSSFFFPLPDNYSNANQNRLMRI